MTRDAAEFYVATWVCEDCATTYTADVKRCGQRQPERCDGWVHPERFIRFTVGELQAFVLAFSAAGAYSPDGRHPWTNEVWGGVAREAAAALERRVLAEDSDPQHGRVSR